MAARKVLFAFRRNQINMGGKIMRVDQLSAMASQFLPETRYQIGTVFVPRVDKIERVRRFVEACRDAVVIFHKSAISHIGEDVRGDIREVAAGTCLDHLDVVIKPMEPGFIDVHIACSRKAEGEMKAHLSQLDQSGHGQVMHLRHHADPRLAALQVGAYDRLVPGYFGAAENTTDLAMYPPDTQVPNYDTREIEAFFQAMTEANLHLCVRPEITWRDLGICPTKPFTKGFNAAAVGANVLVNRQVDDAVHYLGDDYPFFIDDDAPQSVATGIELARAAYESDVWQDGLDRIASVAARVRPQKVVRELQQIIDLF